MKSERLKGERVFRELFRRGRRAEAQYFRVVWLPNPGSHLSIAFITPKAIDKRATQRNLIRRRAREWTYRRPEYVELPIRVAITFKVGVLQATKQEFYAALKETFNRLQRSTRPY